ncbi:MAG: PfkB family carbohydrate kinase [Bacteroidota bacterium]
MTPPPELLCIGELLMDLISTDYAADFRSANRYQRLPGGSPANLAMNAARLGRRVALAATVGQDDAGALLTEAVAQAGVDTRLIYRHSDPTTLILVTKSKAVSDFEAYRSADRHLTSEQLAGDFVTKAKIAHTTAFALSREPARSAILAALKRVAKAGGTVTLDYNYADKIWGNDRAVGRSVLQDVCQIAPLLKFSEVDYARLFEAQVRDPRRAAKRILDLGAKLVCLTLGEEGCYVLGDGADFHLAVRPVEVKDTTGAGDAFWSGFLSAHLGGYGWEECARAGRGMAERKLGTVGPLTEQVNLAALID